MAFKLLKHGFHITDMQKQICVAMNFMLQIIENRNVTVNFILQIL
jgi:hypothetical protein